MKTIVESLVRKNILSLKPYSSARDEFHGIATVYLDANESPYPSEYNRYPDPHQLKLKKRISELKNVSVDQIFLGNGSDEPIDLLIRAFCEPGVDNVLIPQPTYGMYTVSANINAVEINTVSFTPEFDIDLQATQNAWDENTKLIFLCSPNNPSGNLLNIEKIKAILTSFSGLVIVDEAYIDFANSASLTSLLAQFQNLVVLQTLSKAWGLAAIRLGMCFAHPPIIEVLNKIKPPYNISGLSQTVALESLGQVEKKDHWVKEILSERERMKSELLSTKLVEKVFPSDANFLLVKVKEAKAVYQQLIARGVVIRDRSSITLCNNCLRITIGTPKENNSLLTELRKI